MADLPSPFPPELAASIRATAVRCADRVATRASAVAEAHELIASTLGRMTATDLGRLFKLFNISRRDGDRVLNDRFSPAFLGVTVGKLLAQIDEVNRWVPRLWTAEDDELDRALTEFYRAELAGAGRSFPTVILHVRDPERFFPLMHGLEGGYALLFGRKVGKDPGAYRRYNAELAEICRTFAVSPHIVDAVLMDVLRANVAAERGSARTASASPSDRPDFARLFTQYESDDRVREFVHHNINILKCVHGGLELVRRHRISFDPGAHYWRLPEHRTIVAYLAERWYGRCAPPGAVRGLALRLFRHFGQLRRDGALLFEGVDYARGGGWAPLCDQLMAHARRLGPLPEYEELRGVWQLPESAADDLLAFLGPLRENPNGPGDVERSYFRRVPWLAYLDAETQDEVARRRAFLFGYSNLLTSNNAYRHAGAQVFAPLIQNTPSDLIVDTVERWMGGESPTRTGFPTFDADDEQPEDRSHYAVVIEIYGLLHLHQTPFYNRQAEQYRRWLPPEYGQADPYDMTAAIGRLTREWLQANPAAVELGARQFRAALASVPLSSPVVFESAADRHARRAGVTSDDMADRALTKEMETLAMARLQALSDLDAAAAFLHLLIDTQVYGAAEPVAEVVVPAGAGSSHARDEALPFGAAPAPVVPDEAPLVLPPGLRPYGERALGYLRAGLHVLFAGAPGTGKTTLAQFVAFAWNHNLAALPAELSLSQAPLTTVANSAWSPFHTIGGLMPDADGKFKPHTGIFIDDTSAGEVAWRLRNECIVLDEMNRADLDRCIGELYPLLSGSVTRVHPAGLPGVRVITASPRFRMIATVNDATIDDIVFPISEGLARRFQRIELPGASEEDLSDFLGCRADNSHGERVQRAIDAVKEFFLIAGEHKLVEREEETDRLRFGVGYFALLRAWADKRLDAASELGDDHRKLARRYLVESLTCVTRDQRLHAALRIFRAQH